MITIISGRSRGDNNTKKVAFEYQRLLAERMIESRILALDEANVFYRDAAFIEMESEFLIPAEKFIIVMPEYNGSYPGILKLMIDNTDVPKCGGIKKCYWWEFLQAGREIYVEWNI